jgi:hypothetical protein
MFGHAMCINGLDGGAQYPNSYETSRGEIGQHYQQAARSQQQNNQECWPGLSSCYYKHAGCPRQKNDSRSQNSGRTNPHKNGMHGSAS